ncbi:MAG: serine protease [Oligoflexales bacterium]|nr:serine protease [Oligoflexales bacterium]
MRWIWFVISASLALHCSIENETLLNPNSDLNIVGGQESNYELRPWMVALVRNSDKAADTQFCGATRISANWILTASHCVSKVKPPNFRAISGVHDLSKIIPKEKIYEIQEIVLHPSYVNRTNNFDFALLRITPHARDETDQAGIQSGKYLPFVKTESKSQINFLTLGWGKLGENKNSSNVLREVEVPLVDDANCKQSYPTLTENMICAGYKLGGKDSCQGDSGGPLVWWDAQKKEWLQMGVVSFGDGCARPNFPGVYSKISKVSQWIQDELTKPLPEGDCEGELLQITDYKVNNNRCNQIVTYNPGFVNGKLERACLYEKNTDKYYKCVYCPNVENIKARMWKKLADKSSALRVCPHGIAH